LKLCPLISNYVQHISTGEGENFSRGASPTPVKGLSMIPNFLCSREVTAAELHLCFVIKGKVWWKRTFLPMATIVVLHHQHMKLFMHLHHILLCGPSENVLISRFVE